jgi:hypothetical protein
MGVSFVTAPLQDLGEDDLGERERRAILKECGATGGLRRIDLV